MSTQSQKVLIGVTGRMDSAVAAYLLKKQGMDVHAVAILFHEQGISPDTNEAKISGAITQYAIDDLALVKKVFDQLEIPFYAVNAQDRYHALVHDPLVAHRLMGKAFNAKISASRLLMSLLFEKAEVINADFIATGHYAKLQKNQRTHESVLFSSHDNNNDQSFLLASLNSKQLGKVLLPLSDMRKAEVEKIAKVMSVVTLPTKKQINIFEQANLGSLIEPFIPPSMRVSGEIHQRYDDSLLAEHTGVYNFFLGQDNETGLDLRRTGLERDMTVVEILPKAGLIRVEEPKKLFFSHIFLTNCRYGDGIDFTFPLDVYVQFKENGERFAGRLFFKNNVACVIEFSKKQNGFIPNGATGVVYSKGQGVSRVLASGIVENSFYYEKGIPRRYPLTQQEEEQDFDPPPKSQIGF